MNWLRMGRFGEHRHQSARGAIHLLRCIVFVSPFFCQKLFRVTHTPTASLILGSDKQASNFYSSICSSLHRSCSQIQQNCSIVPAAATTTVQSYMTLLSRNLSLDKLCPRCKMCVYSMSSERRAAFELQRDPIRW